ncbi:putative leader peptide [Streptomyces sp. NBC_01092]|uniref:putative leader peptide n=1 Tax=Streptomyces sp. NBC_01092 TaxID=2903748 RepID=UPI0038684664
MHTEASPREPDDGELTGSRRHGVLPTMTDTCVRLWRRVHMDLVRYAGCVCRPSC